MITTRRQFIGSSLAATAVATTSVAAGAVVNAEETAVTTPQTVEQPSIIDSPPVLQIPSETSIGIAWAVKELASGFVEVSETEDFANAQKTKTGGLTLISTDDRILSARIEGLKPGTKYYYRTTTIPVNYPNAYKVTVGEPVVSPASSFSTMGPTAESAFAVINDTHSNEPTFKMLDAKLREVNAPVTIWCGDLGEMSSADSAVQYLLRPGDTAFATERPMLFVPGNHDYRGPWCRNMEKVLLKRTPTERDSRYWELGRNFALRQGDIAMIGLDTGEDKPDNHPVFVGLANFGPYRKLQSEWLEDALQRPEIQDAKFKVAFCHIPLFDPRVNANPGDTLEGFASWQRPSSGYWTPLFKKYGVQLLICAHMHQHRIDPPTEDRPWAQIVGAGHQRGSGATVIEGRVINDELVITVNEVFSQKVINRYVIK